MKFKIILFSLLFVLASCSSMTGRKLSVSMYNDPSEGEVASVEFVNSDPFVYEKGEPSEKEIHVIKWIADTFRTKSAKIYADPENCVDYKIFDLSSNDKQVYLIPANEMLTFEYRAVANTDKKIAWCPNSFSFVAEPNSKYTVANTLYVNDIKYGGCKVRVYKDDDFQNPVKIIARDDAPTFWTSTSPRCAKKELENPKWVNESENRFECVIKVGSYSC